MNSYGRTRAKQITDMPNNKAETSATGAVVAQPQAPSQFYFIKVKDSIQDQWLCNDQTLLKTRRPEDALAFTPTEAENVIKRLKQLGYQGLSVVKASAMPRVTPASEFLCYRDMTNSQRAAFDARNGISLADRARVAAQLSGNTLTAKTPFTAP